MMMTMTTMMTMKSMIQRGNAGGVLQLRTGTGTSVMSMMMMCGSVSAQRVRGESGVGSGGAGSAGVGRRSVHSDVRGEEATTVLEAALVQVPTHGWSVRAIREGAVSLSLSPAIAASFKRGEAELVEYFVRKCNSALAKQLDDERATVLASMGDTETRLAYALNERLKMVQPFARSWPQALKVQAHPHNFPESVRNLAELADEVWHACGDDATDLSWYTKRMALAGVYSASEVFMLTDYSPNFVDTKAFLERRLASNWT